MPVCMFYGRRTRFLLPGFVFFRGVGEEDGVRSSESYYVGLSISSVLQWVIRSESWALRLPEQVMCDE